MAISKLFTIFAHNYSQTSNYKVIMIQENTILNANPIVTFLQKPATSFTKADIINYMRSAW